MPSNLRFTIGLHLDAEQLEKKLSVIKNEIDNTFTIRGKMTEEINKATQSARVLEKALEKATTTKGISYAAFNAELKKAGMTAGQLTTTLALGGEKFRASLSAANAALALSNRQVVTLNKHIQEVARVTMQTFKYTASNMLFHEMVSQAQQAVRWVTDLNDAVNDIAIVTGKTGDQITRVTEQAIKGSRELRVAARDYAEGALIFYQQGLNDEEVKRRNEVTIKAAKAAGQSVEQMSQQLTAIWNTYGMVADQQERAASIGAKMAAQTAVDFKDIAEAMQIAASPASQMGVSFESLAAIIATVGDTTRQSASIIGNAYKTIFSRMQQLKVDGTDGEVTFKAMSQQLSAMGIALEDNAGHLLSLDKVIDQVGEKWGTWTNKQQLAVAELVGGTRQYGQFLALMQNYDKYLTNLRTAQAEGVETLNQQYTQALDSIESRAENASEAWHRAWSKTFDVDDIKAFYSVSEGLANVFGTLVKTVSGLPGILGIVALLMREKIMPIGLQIKSFVQDTFNSMTHEGRVRGIQSDYASQRAALSSEIGLRENQIKSLRDKDTTKTKVRNNFKIARIQESINDLQYQQQMAEFDEQIALKNEQINTELAKATGERRAQLELAQAQLATDRDIYEQNLKNIYSKESFGLKTAKKAILTAVETPEGEQETAGAKRIRSLMGLSEYTTGLLQEMGRGTFTADQIRSNLAWKIGKILNNDSANGVDNPLRGALSSVAKDLKDDDVDFEEAIADLVAKINANLGRDIPDAVVDAGEKVCQALEKFAGDAVAAAKVADKTNPDNPLNEPPEEPSQDEGPSPEGEGEGRRGYKKWNELTKSEKVQRGINAAVAGYTNFQMASNAMDTFVDSSATVADKLGSLTGAMGSFGATIAMVPGPLGWVTALLTTGLPLIISLIEKATKKREEEEKRIQSSIETIDAQIDIYKKTDETLKTAKRGSSEYLSAINQQIEAYLTLAKELKASNLDVNKFFREVNGHKILNYGAMENAREQMAIQLQQMQLEDNRRNTQKSLSDITTTLQKAGIDKTGSEFASLESLDRIFTSQQIADAGGKEALIELWNQAKIYQNTIDAIDLSLKSLIIDLQNLKNIEVFDENGGLTEEFKEANAMLEQRAALYQNTTEEVIAFEEAANRLEAAVKNYEDTTSGWGRTRSLDEKTSALSNFEEQRENLILATRVGEDTVTHNLGKAEVIENVARAFKAYNDTLEEKNEIEKDGIKYAKSTGDLAAENATKYTRLNRAIQDLNNNYKKTYEDIINAFKYAGTAADKAALAAKDGYQELKNVIADLIDTDVSGITDEFLQSLNGEDLLGAANASETAIDNIIDSWQRYLVTMAGLDPEVLNPFQQIMDTLQDNELIPTQTISGVQTLKDEMSFLGDVLAQTDGSFSSLKDTLSDFGISATPRFLYSMDEIKEASAQTGTAVIKNLSLNAKINKANAPVSSEIDVSSYQMKVTPIDLGNQPLVGLMSDISSDQDIGALLSAHMTGFTLSAEQLESEPIKEEGNQEVMAVALENMNKQGFGGKISQESKNLPTVPKTSKGGGGGGGKGKKFTPKKQSSSSNSKKIGQRYLNIQSRIDKTKRSIDKLKEAESDAWGAQTFKNLKGVNNLLIEQAQHLQALRHEAEGYLKDDIADLRRILNNEWKKGDTWDTDIYSGLKIKTELDVDEVTGFVHNWEQIQKEYEAERQRLQDEVDAAYDAYNEAKDAENETLEEAIKTADDRLKEFMNQYNQAEDALKQLQETNQKIEETLKQEVAQIKEWISDLVKMAQVKLELKIKISEDDIKVLEHIIDLWGDLGTVMDQNWRKYREIAISQTTQVAAYKENAEKMAMYLNEVQPDSSWRASYVARFGEAAWNRYIEGNGGQPKEVLDQFEEAVGKMRDAIWSLEETLDKMLKEWIRLFNIYLNRFERIANKLAQNSSLIDMLVSILNATGRNYTVEGTAAAANAAKAKYSIAKATSKGAVAKYQYTQEAYRIAKDAKDAFEAQYGTDITSMAEGHAIWYKQLVADEEETYKAMDDALTEVKSSISEWADAMTEMLEASTEAIRRAFWDRLGGLMGTNGDEALDLFSAQGELEDLFLTKLTKDYELDKLQNMVEAYLDDNDIENIERYSDLLDEINAAQQESVQINQTDLEILQAKFELEQARDQYEEMQRYKNTMRLARDASGNWSYVYSGEQNTAQQQEELLQTIKDNTYKIQKLQEDAAKATEEAWLPTFIDLTKWYEELGTARAQQDEDYRRVVEEHIRIDQQKLEIYKDEIIKRYGAIDERFEDSKLAWITGYGDMQALQTDYLGFSAQFGYDLSTNTQEIVDDFLSDVQVVTNGVVDLKGNYGDLEEFINQKSEQIISENQKIAQEFNNLKQTGIEAIRDMSNSMQGDIENLIMTIEQLLRELDELQRKLRESQDKAIEGIEAEDFDESLNYAGVSLNAMLNTGVLGSVASGALSGEQALENFKSQNPERYKEWYRKLKKYGDGSGKDFSNMTMDEFDSYILDKVILGMGVNDLRSGKTLSYETLDARFPKSSASGNYFSHPDITTIAENGPEIVLNPDDTRNILAAVRMVRSTINNGLGYSASVGFGIASHNASIGSMGGAGLTVQTPVQQAVSIDANFPNVNVANEVETALDSLILQATQYAAQR